MNCLTCDLTIKENRRYCSQSCANKSRIGKKPPLMVVCGQCATEFKTYPSLKSKFCSRSCASKHQGNRHMLKAWTPEWRAKASEAQRARFAKNKPVWTGKKLPDRSGENHYFWGKKRPEMSGERNPKWRGGVSFGTRFTAEYKVWRKHVFDRDNYTCVDCGDGKTYLHADHILPYADYPDERYNVHNGRTLCVACHYKRTFSRPMIPGTSFGVNKKVRVAKF